jgi:hypothetical protein
LLISGILILIAGAGIYWYIATDKFSDTKDRKPAFTVSAADFIHEFNQNDSLANAKYGNKIVQVNGRVSEIESADTVLNIKFIDSATGSYAIFAFQDQHVHEASTVKTGDSISIKGSFSSSIYSEILGITAITFKRSTLSN